MGNQEQQVAIHNAQGLPPIALIVPFGNQHFPKNGQWLGFKTSYADNSFPFSSGKISLDNSCV